MKTVILYRITDFYKKNKIILTKINFIPIIKSIKISFLQKKMLKMHNAFRVFFKRI